MPDALPESKAITSYSDASLQLRWLL